MSLIKENEYKMKNWYKIAKTVIPPQDMAALESIIKKIMKGHRKWSPEELQAQINYPELLEDMLMQKYEALEN